jgi:hypothetical protein
MVNPNRFYTYAYLREDRTPYYIGKGKGDRVYKKRKSEIKPPKDKSRIIFLKQNLTEAEAFKHEIYMIAVYGRKDLGTGILYNRTGGGEGSSGLTHSPETKAKMSATRKGENHHFYGKTHSEETKEKMSSAKKGKIFSAEHRAKMSSARKGENGAMYGKTHSPEARAKMSATRKGKTHSPESRAKQSAAKKGKNNHMYGKMWITNGIVAFMILKTDTIPEGFVKGKTLEKPSQDLPIFLPEVV